MPAAKAPTSLRRLFDDIGTVDQVGIEERVAKYTTRSLKKKSKVFGLRLAVTMVDLTTLEGKDTPGKVASLCQKALTPHDIGDIPSTAAVCVYPSMVKHAKKHVGGTQVKIASVATAFPSGQAPLKTRLAEVRAAVADGADEIDMVINRGAFLSGEFGLMQDEIARSAYTYQKHIEDGSKIIVGVNKFETTDHYHTQLLKIDESIQKTQIEKINSLRQRRNNEAVEICLKRISEAASGTENIMPFVVDAVEQYCTLGEISDTLRGIYGEYK